ncbi:ABC-type branched-chain amino acid transport systems (plasmid) [Cupriavidus necator]|uniref:ABC-type branched-chain amino acid transport systems n=1 Tax=Cupriavidus necator TaxID=106590 RepID=A0A1U9V3Y7_CUPNE|nr:ABC-type branched-chain amino acid transport systems [Cupriavidus necator]
MFIKHRLKRVRKESFLHRYETNGESAMKSIFKSSFRNVTAFACAVICTTAAQIGHAQERQPCIGLSGALTGPQAFTGLAARMGAEIAIDEINASGGVLGKKLVLKVYDDGGQPPKEGWPPFANM